MVLGAQPGQGVRRAVPEQVLTVQPGRMAKGPALGKGAQGHSASRPGRPRRLLYRQCWAKQGSRAAYTGTLRVAL